jgi:hypothetical protein
MSMCGFCNVCPNHPHFLLLISSSAGTWAIFLPRSWLLIVSGHLTWRFLRRHQLIKVCNYVVAFFDTNLDSLTYNRTDLTLEFKILIIVISFSFVELCIGSRLLKAAFTLFI